jgi:antitoxin VapB
MHKIAKIFNNGRSQAVRLPAEYRFKGKEVFIRQDEKTGDVILSARPENWDNFLKLVQNAEIDDSFLNSEERNQSTKLKDPFSDLDFDS